MSFSDFNSLFELFVVFNFAYIFSVNFQEILNSYILKPSENLSTRTKEASEKKDVLEVSLNQLQIDQTSFNNVNVISEIREKLGIIHDSYRKLDEANSSNISRMKITSGFSTISLFSALYCIFMLFVGGLNKLPISDMNLLQTIFLFNLLYLIFIKIVFIRDHIGQYKEKAMNHFIPISIFVVGLISSVILARYSINNNLCVIYTNDLNFTEKNILIIVSVILPMSHFIFYFIRAIFIYFIYLRSTTKLINEYDANLKSFEEKEIANTKLFNEYFEKCRITNGDDTPSAGSE